MSHLEYDVGLCVFECGIVEKRTGIYLERRIERVFHLTIETPSGSNIRCFESQLLYKQRVMGFLSGVPEFDLNDS